jgi:hypothetical protein
MALITFYSIDYSIPRLNYFFELGGVVMGFGGFGGRGFGGGGAIIIIIILLLFFCCCGDDFSSSC